MSKINFFLTFVKLLAKFFYGYVKVAKVNVIFPSVNIETPIKLWFDNILSLNLGREISIGPYSEIVVLNSSSSSNIPGKLIIEDQVVIGKGANIRAAGGEVFIGKGTIIAQDVSIVASNHVIGNGKMFSKQEWDTSKAGVVIKENVWIGAGCIILPGVTIGANSVVAAGAVVTKTIPDNQLWGGVPASYIRTIN